MASNDRRQFLRVLTGIGVLGLAGCSGDGSDTATETDPPTATDGTPDTGTAADTATVTTAPSTTSTGTVTEGFESDWEDTFEDTSQAGSSPELTTEHAAEGEQALDLSAAPGDNTTNSVLTRTAFAAPLTAEVRVKRYESGGPNNGAGMALVATDSDRKTALSQSGSNDGVIMNVFDETGERVARKTVSGSNTDEWHATSIEITADGAVVASAFGDSATHDPDGDWTGASFKMELQANGWEEGHAVGAAYDAVRIEEGGG